MESRVVIGGLVLATLHAAPVYADPAPPDPAPTIPVVTQSPPPPPAPTPTSPSAPGPAPGPDPATSTSPSSDPDSVSGPAPSPPATFDGLREATYPAAAYGETETRVPAPLANNERRHDGFFFRGSLGVVRSSLGGSGGHTGASPELLFGGTPGKGLVLGGGIVGIGGNNSGNFAYAGFAQYYPDPTAGFHGQAMAGIAVLRSENAGPFVAGGIGMDGWVGAQTSLGVFGRLGYTMGEDAGGTPDSGGGSVFGSVAFTLTVH